MLYNQKLKEFLYSLFGQCTDCKLSIMTLPDKQIRHYLPEQLDQLIADGQRLGAVCNTYFDVNPKIQSLKDGLRGGSETVQYLCSLYADIDVFGPAHMRPRWIITPGTYRANPTGSSWVYTRTKAYPPPIQKSEKDSTAW